MTSEVGKHRTALEQTNRELDQKVNELSDLANYNDTILASMTSGLMALDLDGHFETLNETAKTILGVRASSSVKGRHYSQMVPVESLFGQIIEGTLQSQASINVPRLEFVRSDGQAVLLGLRTAMRRDHSQTFGMLVVFEDLSPVQTLERRLRQADRLAAVIWLKLRAKTAISSRGRRLASLPSNLESGMQYARRAMPPPPS